ncbi:MotA/TolQ/ExbB proton channel domain-containing protein [Caenorhabditis elegans]|uniref:MotA/TolQ/ExbB proton channel domain-containing protein n=1 Tax=Caenorhabditis elegans TaxID=6239 RepID=Q9U5B9_CAEEL|nr:MotA/TolQ/ExbB proton channel domain-containing protein [Caenorhabditis elegans]CCD69620.2 MotA/TolQ/ExbB proton channel domain-containing protein [Caenorhabditis elegans]|eukprot:NP_494247.2 Uncharacterized protein CELE_F43C11.6 [Caenorhabditis elegans]
MFLLDFLFLVSWILLLLGIFILTREAVFQWHKSENLSIFGAFLVTMIIFIEAILMLEEHKWKDDTLSNQLLRWMFGKAESTHWKWHVNPVTVPFSLLGRIIILCASVFGESCGKLIGRFIAELPLATSLVMVPFSFLCIFLGIFCIFGYQFNIGYGFLKVERNNRLKSIFKPSDTAGNSSKKLEKCISKIDFCVKKVNEGYQKTIEKLKN